MLSRTYFLPISLILAIGLLALSCTNKSKNSDQDNKLALGLLIQNDKVGEALTSAFDPVSGSMEGLSGEGASTALYRTKPAFGEEVAYTFYKLWQKGPSLGELQAYNISFDCLGGGDYQRQVYSTDTNAYDFIDYFLNGNHPSSSFFASKDFQNCKFLPFTSWKIDGVSENIWSGLSSSSPFVQNGTVLKIGINRTIENSSRGISYKVTGSGSALTYGAGSPTTNLAYTLTWNNILTGQMSGISSYSQDVSVLREAYSGADLVYSHAITTPSSLQYGADKSDSNPLSWYRLWSAGSIQVQHVEENFTLLVSVTSPVKWKYVDCLPKSGEVSFTLSGSLTGSGVMSFSNGSGHYTYSVTDADGNSSSGNGSVDFSSCAVPLILL
ncbi:hypothetical protein EHQ53_13820 [Leptospira langatensis]|uniref:Lipoprotein n=1 Tax=Leptospira langatensis TaxID=2484983 RepID=A0A5F1ZR11_9LEPT|nr:hypothetical protein [Leptospira langatensis]TGK02559.1 hypothetical protein EHO57_04295 [Leptospira langatensis]TGL40240.1 hypothetical protein EHQ53_13820 [Leptospira langatensis]